MKEKIFQKIRCRSITNLSKCFLRFLNLQKNEIHVFWGENCRRCEKIFQKNKIIVDVIWKLTFYSLNLSEGATLFMGGVKVSAHKSVPALRHSDGRPRGVCSFWRFSYSMSTDCTLGASLLCRRFAPRFVCFEAPVWISVELGSLLCLGRLCERHW